MMNPIDYISREISELNPAKFEQDLSYAIAKKRSWKGRVVTLGYSIQNHVDVIIKSIKELKVYSLDEHLNKKMQDQLADFNKKVKELRNQINSEKDPIIQTSLSNALKDKLIKIQSILIEINNQQTKEDLKPKVKLNSITLYDLNATITSIDRVKNLKVKNIDFNQM